MRKVIDLLKLGWVQLLLALAAVGGTPGVLMLWDRMFPDPPRVVTSPQALSPAPSAKKKLETGALPSKPDPEPNFLSNPWAWFEWNERRNEAKCDRYATDKPLWCNPR